jgi:hypothetical protein
MAVCVRVVDNHVDVQGHTFLCQDTGEPTRKWYLLLVLPLSCCIVLACVLSGKR